MSTCSTVSELIEAFGGGSAMARRFGVTAAAVSNWKAAQRLPERLHYRISREAEADGIRVSPVLFESRAA